MSTRPRAEKIRVAIATEQSAHPVPRPLLRRTVKEVLQGEGVRSATISLAIVDDPTIHRLNHQYLQHDYPTDVLSFLLDGSIDEQFIDGEIVVSVDTAAANSGEYGTTTEREIVLYVVHGLLHLVGYDDHDPAKKRQMRRKEQEYLQRLGLPVATAPAKPHRGSRRRPGSSKPT